MVYGALRCRFKLRAKQLVDVAVVIVAHIRVVFAFRLHGVISETLLSICQSDR